MIVNGSTRLIAVFPHFPRKDISMKKAFVALLTTAFVSAVFAQGTAPTAPATAASKAAVVQAAPEPKSTTGAPSTASMSKPKSTTKTASASSKSSVTGSTANQYKKKPKKTAPSTAMSTDAKPAK